MKRIGVVLAAAIVVGAFCLMRLVPMPLFAQSSIYGLISACPLLLSHGQGTKAEIVRMTFTDEIVGSQGNRMKIPENMKARMRIALVTVKITKPPGKKLTLPAADVTLHYYHGNYAECAPCEGISSFTTEEDSPRPVNLSTNSGPGFVKQTTGTRSTHSGIVYVDAVFCYMEPDTRECWICMAQTTMSEPFVCQGWTP